MAITAMTGNNLSLFARIPWLRTREVKRYKGYPFHIELDGAGKVCNVVGKLRIITTQGVEGLIKDGRDIRLYKGRVVMIIHLGSSEQKDFMITEMNEEIERHRRRVRSIVTADKPPQKTAVTED